jgi:predicted TIM-barrel fold metal-dependent hydrolase
MTIVPNSAGTAAPRLRVPPKACDSHMHIFDPARPRAAGSTGHGAEHATCADYRLLQQRLGIERAVVVTPRYYLDDNGVTLDAIRDLGAERTRGIGVVGPDITDRELLALRDGGIRGLRYTTPHVAADHPVFQEAAALAPRLEALGMHLQLHWTVEQILVHADQLMALPCTVVIDHMGRLPKGQGLAHPAYGVLRRRLDDGRTWVKLSGWYLDSEVGSPWPDTVAIGAEFARAAPERMVWGTDWPHVSPGPKPDGALLLDVLEQVIPDASLRERVLVDNPAELYGF